MQPFNPLPHEPLKTQLELGIEILEEIEDIITDDAFTSAQWDKIETKLGSAIWYLQEYQDLENKK